MAGTRDYTYSQVASHNTKDDLFIIINDQVYDVSKFVYEHPGGEEVLADVAGRDATDEFGSVGHSEQAKAILETLMVGKLKKTPQDSKSKQAVQVSYKSSPSTTTSKDSGIGIRMYVMVVLAIAGIFAMRKYMQAQEVK
ncbi:cytochrome b5 [Lepidopterella palustris CBS 459.81]|uniref:Cytochrome b5 n=1 Tax=Lepidopterella palustris CBS 459.81 TaxID=1314670 RepID=A0A8E2E2Q9_9PEZI|nr:cytochrome b5 [Lepidopterella palustris CBS 459.81]